MPSKRELLHQGSVKDIWAASPDTLLFSFSDRYSIFDWGEMPDLIPGKGQALAQMARDFFLFLERQAQAQGRPFCHHYRRGPGAAEQGVIEVDRYRVLPLETSEGTSERTSEETNHGADYRAYQDRPEHCLVPLEVIFRFGVPAGSSLPSRLEKDPAYRQSLGLSGPVSEGDFLPRALVEFSTKLEEQDRYLTYQQARQLAALSAGEAASLQEMALWAAGELKEFFARLGLCLWDGKFEFAFGPHGPHGQQKERAGQERSLVLVDSIGPDEMRLSKDGVPLSKEALRQCYHGSSWQQEVAAAKVRWPGDWKKHVAARPAALAPQQKQWAEQLYRLLAKACGEAMAGGPAKENAFDSLVASYPQVAYGQ